MATRALRELFISGLHTLHAADRQCIASATQVVTDVANPHLREAIQAAIRMADRQVGELDQVFQHAGAVPGGEENAVIAAIAVATQRAQESAADDMAHDLGVVATSRQAFHYYIACYGTLRDYALALRLPEAAGLLDDMRDELEQADRQFAQIAQQIIGIGWNTGMREVVSHDVAYALE